MNPFDADPRSLYSRVTHAPRRTSLDALFERVPECAEVLDVGLGDGSLGARLARARGCVIDGVTLSAEEAARVRSTYRRVEVADLNQTPLDRLFAGQRYAAIICADVLEHLPRPGAVLDACRQLLADDGRLLVSIPNVGYSGLIAELLGGEFRYRAEGLLDRTHMRFFTRRSLLRLLREQAWSVDEFEAITLDIRDSEFRPAFDLLPPAVRRYLLALPDGLSYQFVVQARAASRSTTAAQASIPEPAATPAAHFSMQLYLKDASGYAEDRKQVAGACIGEQRQRVVFDVPAAVTGLSGLRLDPADRPGFLHLFAIRLRDVRSAEVWTWDGRVESLESGNPHQVVFRTPWTAAEGAVLLLCGDDPHFELPIDARHFENCAEGATLEVELAWPMSADYLVLVDRLTQDRDRQEALREQLAQAHAANEQARDEAQRQGAEIAEAQAQLDKQQADQSALAAQLAVARAEVERLGQQRAQLARKLRDRKAQLRAAGEEATSLAHALSAASGARAGAAEERDRWQARVRALEASRWFAWGRRLARTLGREASPLVRPTELPPAAPPRAIRPPRAGISVVVPVYVGLAETTACIESVLAGTSKAMVHVVLVNDASPDPEIAAYLRGVAKRDSRVELIENDTNLGFVASANRGMQQRGDDDVILLNSDTEVAGDWIDRLRDAAYREHGIATVTPFSNAATICGYPRFCVDGPMPTDMSTAALDRYFVAENAGRSLDIPTAVGFCMFIRRDCLDEVGLFDAERFGRGYGEENDFCMRARTSGWRHVLALDTFVRHFGGVSFGAEKAARVDEAQRRLASLHPEYPSLIARHLQEDPARPARLRVDLARIRARGLPSVLFVSHAGGGGTERHLRELADAMAAQANFFVLRPVGEGEAALAWLRPGEGFGLGFRLPEQYEPLLAALRALGVAHVHFHHLRGHDPCVMGLAASLGVRHDFTVHDFYAACPQVTMTDEFGRYCSEFGPEQCAGCLARRPAPGESIIEAWRELFRPLLEQARHVFAPSEDAATRLARYFPAVSPRRVPHFDVAEPPAAPSPTPIRGLRPLRVVVIGALSQIKGADLLDATAALAAQRGSRLEFHLLGYAYRALRAPPAARLVVHGEYAEEDLPGRLEEIGADLAWFPALWPETYCYALSAALSARLPVVAADLGAFPERLSARPWTWVCPWYRLSEEWVQFFERLLAEHFDPGHPPPLAPQRTVRPAEFSYFSDYLQGLPSKVAAAPLPADFVDGFLPSRAGNA